MPELTVTTVRTFDELDDLADDWVRLERQAYAPVFQSWHWNRTWCRVVLGDAGSAPLRVGVIRERTGRVRGILPLYEQRAAGPLVRVLQFLGHRMSYHNDALFGDDDPELARAATSALTRGLGLGAVVHLRHLHAGSPLLGALSAHGRLHPQCDRILMAYDPEVEDPSARLGRSSRKTYRKRRNALERDHGLELRAASGADVGPAFDRFLELHRMRFASAGRDTLMSGDNETFYREVILNDPEPGRFELAELWTNERAIASVLCVRTGERYFNINTGFDPEFGSYSPLVLLIGEAMRRAFGELGCRLYDVGPGYEGYKYTWNPRVDTNHYACIGARDPYSLAVAAALRRAFERSLPTPPAEAARTSSAA